jgi:crossover junction endodeoxyribonuclease RuvC
VSTPVRVAGIDLSLTATGVASVAVAAGVAPVWRTWRVDSPSQGPDVARQATRIVGASRRIVAAVLDTDPALAVVEGLPPGTHQAGIRDTAGQWWRVVGDLVAAGIPVGIVMPSTRQTYALGHGRPLGRAGKPAVVAAVTARYPEALVGGMHDVADAVVLAAMGARWLGRPVDALSGDHTRAIASSRWPAMPRGGPALQRGA